AALRQYLEWFGSANVFIELQRNLLKGEGARNRRLAELAGRLGAGLVATNNVHYHIRDRHRLQDALVAIRYNLTLDEAAPYLRTNSQYYLKSAKQMAALFRSCPEAVSNTVRIAHRCSFNLITDLGYQFSDHPVPEGHTPSSYLRELCHQAAVRRYGGVIQRVKARLDEEFRLIEKHHLAGFLLMYYDIIQLAREVMIDLGLTDREIPLEERPPGRGRGSSVAMLVGYLIGLSHIDPLGFNLSLERFLPEDMTSVPDIDLDFPRNIREELIKRVHEEWGWDRAALTGMVATYQMKGAIRGLGKALGLSRQDVDRLARRVESSSAKELALEMETLPEFMDRVDAPVWRDLVDLASQLDGFPQYLAQHTGGMIFSSSPLTSMVPVQPSAMEGVHLPLGQGRN
ncbi:MAG TPA: error-prone DNA polymerase, partial [Dehalococcoidia bacterium]|nr:error-prone DNA polymerase [Dehalococcoidia bacterium]